MTYVKEQTIKMFYCYAPEDDALRAKLATHLSLLKRLSLTTEWIEQDVQTGQNWAEEVESHFDAAHIVLLLLSPDFIASDNCYSQLEKATMRHLEGQIYVIPILLRPMIWEDLPVSQLAPLPREKSLTKAVTLWPNQDEAFENIAQMVRSLVLSFLPEHLHLPAVGKHTAASDRGDEAFLTLPRRHESATSSLSLSKTRPFTQYIPILRNKNFVGREPILREMSAKFQQSRKGAPVRYALSGLAGIGKTQTALEYAYRYGDQYTIVIWLSAHTYETLQTDSRESALLLKLLPQERDAYFSLPAIRDIHEPDLGVANSNQTQADATTTHERHTGGTRGIFASLPLQNAPKTLKVDYLSLLKKWLENNDQWLLVLDNVEDIDILREVLPRRGNGHVLLTTRLTSLGSLAEPIVLEKMTLEEGASMLLRRAALVASEYNEREKRENQECARKLAEMMDGLPLALDQAGAYIQETQISIKEYVALYNDQEKSPGLLTVRGDVYDHPDSVTTTFRLSIEKMKSTHAVSAQVLSICAFLHPDAIPEEILTEAIHTLSGQTTVDEIAQIEILKSLLRYSVLRRNPAARTYTIHRVLQIVLKNSMSEQEQKQQLELTLAILNNAAIPLDEAKPTGSKRQERSLAQLYLPHAQSCAEHIQTWDIQSNEAEELLNRAGAYLYLQRQFADAQQFYQQLLYIKLARGAPALDQARLLMILANLAYVQRSNDRKVREEAVQRYQEALNIYERELGTYDPCIGQLLTHYAILLRRMKRKQEAEELAERARLIAKRLTETQKTRWKARWVGNLDGDGAGCGMAFVLGIAYSIPVAIPVAVGFCTQSVWLGLGTLLLIVLGLISTHVPWMKHAETFSGLPGVAAGICGWLLTGDALVAWHWTQMPVFWQVVLQSISALLFGGVGFFLSLITCFVVMEMTTIPVYSLTPSLTTLLDTCILPILLGVMLHSWGIFLGSLVVLWFLLLILSLVRRYTWLISVPLSCFWAWAAGELARELDGGHLPLPSLLGFALAGLLVGVLAHNITATQLDIVDAENSTFLVLEDLWVPFEAASLLTSATTKPLKNWTDLYVALGGAYKEQERYAEAFMSYTRAIVNASHKANSYNDRGNLSFAQEDYASSIADYDQAIALYAHSAIYYSNRASAYFRLSDYAHAIADYDQAISLDPQNSDYYYNRGYAYYKQDRYDRALKDYTQAITLDPNQASSHNHLGNTFYAQGQYELARTSYNRAITLDPHSAVYYYNRGSTYTKQNDYVHACEDYTQAIALDPKSADYYNERGKTFYAQGQYELASADYARACMLEPSNAIYYDYWGDALYQQGDYARAIESYTQAIALDPQKAVYYNDRGNAFYAQGQHELARADYDRAIELQPTCAVYYDNRGSVFSQQKDYAHACEDYTQAIALDPDNPDYYDRRGDAWYYQKDYTRACEDYTRAIALQPDHATYYNNRGHVYYQIEDYAKAFADYDRATALDPANPGYWNNRGNAFYRQRDYIRAIADYNHAIQLDANDALYYDNRGASYHAQGEYERALADYNHALSLNANMPEIYADRGDTYYAQQDYIRAFADYDQAIALAPTDARYYRMRGKARHGQGQYTLALADYERALMLDPEDNEVQKLHRLVIEHVTNQNS